MRKLGIYYQVSDNEHWNSLELCKSVDEAKEKIKKLKTNKSFETVRHFFIKKIEVWINESDKEIYTYEDNHKIKVPNDTIKKKIQ